MDDTVHIVTLDQRPCVVQYLEHYNKFIVGTYELFSSLEDARLRLNSHCIDDSQLNKTLERINHRAGKLILLRGNDVSVPNIEYEFDCNSGGGVFEIKVRYNRIDSSYNIYVAHSNGTIGIYKLSLNCGNKIALKEHITVNGSKMLTSIDIFPEPGYTDDNTNSASDVFFPSTNHLSSTSSVLSPTNIPGNSSPTTRLRSTSTPLLNRLVVGDSSGFITVVNRGEPIREQVTQGDSIWQVKSLKLASGRDIIIVGAENSSWYIYGIDEQARKLILLYKNEFKDFTAGITCISILDIIHSTEYDLVEVLLGSYDETLQTYHVKLNHDGISKPGVCHKNTISINDGGIWRVKQLKGTNNEKQLCIAAMYAGSYLLSLSGSESQTAEEKLTKLIDTESLKLKNKPLHYDVDVSSCNTTYCIVDFNNSLCVFKTIDH